MRYPPPRAAGTGARAAGTATPRRPWDAPYSPIDEGAEVPQDQPPRQQQLETVRRQHRQRSRHSQSVAQRHSRPEGPAIGDGAPGGPLIAEASARAGALDQTNRHPTGSSPPSGRKSCARGIVPGWCRARGRQARSTPERHPSSRSRISAPSSAFAKASSRRFAEPLGLGTDDVASEVVVLRRARQILADGLQRHGPRPDATAPGRSAAAGRAPGRVDHRPQRRAPGRSA